MIILERKNNRVYCNGRQLTIVAQASKGEGKEVVKIEGLEGSNGQKYVSLSKLAEGLNEIECQGKEITLGYYTEEERERLKELQDEIDAIKARARERKPLKLDLSKLDISKLTTEQKVEYKKMLEARIAELEKKA